MSLKKISGPLMLLLTAMIWGSAFVAQSIGMEYVGPFTYVCSRSFLGTIVLIPLILVLSKGKKRTKPTGTTKDLVIAGLVCGTFFTIANLFQQFGLIYTTVGKSGFITTLYVVLVPVIGLLIGKRVPWVMWICVALSLCGLYLLCMSGTLDLNRGDLLTMLCALFYSFHIIAIDHFAPKVDGVKLSCIQFFFCFLVCLFPTVLIEQPSFGVILTAWKPIAYGGILSCGVAYTLQIIAQNRTDPTVASLLMCMESVFSVIFGWLILGQMLSSREFIGCALMFVSIILAQFADRIASPLKNR